MSAVKANESMNDPRPNEQIEMVNTETGERVRLWPIDVTELEATAHAGRWVRAEGYTPPVPPATTTADLTPEPAPLPGQPKRSTGGRVGKGEGGE